MNEAMTTVGLLFIVKNPNMWLRLRLKTTINGYFTARGDFSLTGFGAASKNVVSRNNTIDIDHKTLV